MVEKLEILQKFGCTYLQGDYSRPLPAGEISAVISALNRSVKNRVTARYSQ